MGNHYHLLIRTPEGNLQRIMRHVNGVYTQYFNRRMHRDGPLFRGRYHAMLVDAQAYWLQLSRYIHRNPAEARMVAKLEDYPWSSYPAYIGKTSVPEWLTTTYILGAIGRSNRHKRYAAYVESGIDDEMHTFFTSLQIPSILGSKMFRKQALKGEVVNSDKPELRSARMLPDIDEIVDVVCKYYGIGPAEIWHKTRGRGVTSPARLVAMYLCQHAGGKRLTEIACQFGLSNYTSAGASIRNLKFRIGENAKLRRDIDCMLQDLTP